MTSPRKNIAIDHITTLGDFAVEIQQPVKNVRRWADRRESTKFPKPVKSLLSVDLYDVGELRKWFAAWSATRRTR
jgi:hypothetical protein